MTFQVSFPQPVTLEQTLQRLSTEGRIALTERLQTLFPVGSLLEVTVAADQQGQPGVILDGKFYRAILPEGLKTGDKLAVVVTDNRETLFLRILAGKDLLPESFQTTTKLGSALESTIKGILTQAALEALRDSSLPPKELAQSATLPMPTAGKFPSMAADQPNLSSAAKLASTAIEQPSLTSPRALPTTPGTSPPATAATLRVQETISMHQEIARLLDTLVTQQLVLNESTLREPQAIQRIFANLTQNQTLRGVQEAQRALEELTRSLPQPQLAKVVSALSEHIELLLSTGNGLGFSQELVLEGSPAVASQLRLATAISLYAMGQPQIIPSLAKGLGLMETKAHPLLILLESLTGLGFLKEDQAAAQDQPLLQLLRAFIGDLTRARDSKASDTEVHQVLTRALATMREQLAHSGRSLRESSQLSQGLEGLKSLEQMLQGQEVLNRLNPLMQHLGEPALVLVPALQDGRLARWEIVPHPRRVDEEDERDSSSRSNASLQKVQLSLELPNLGRIQVDLAHRKGEVLLNLTLESTSAQNFVSQHLDSLEKTFRELGYEKTQLSARQGTIETIRPPWYQELTRRAVIA